MNENTFQNLWKKLNAWDDNRELFLHLSNWKSYLLNNVILLNNKVVFTLYSSANTDYFSNIGHLKKLLINTYPSIHNFDFKENTIIDVEIGLFKYIEINRIYVSAGEVVIEEKWIIWKIINKIKNIYN